MYETESLKALTAPDYLARLNAPTEWTRRSVVQLRKSVRGIATVITSIGRGVGSVIMTIRTRAAGHNFIEPLLVGGDASSVLGIHLCSANKLVSTIPTTERALRPVSTPDTFLIVEGTDPVALRTLAQDLAKRSGHSVQIDLYRLEMQQTVARERNSTS